MSYTSENIQQRHEEVIEAIKAMNGLIPDEHRVGGKIQLTHVGVFQANPDAKNPVLVALIDGVMFCINNITYTNAAGNLPAEETVDAYIRLSRNSVGGTVDAVSLSMEERCQRYNDNEGSLGKFLQIIPVKDTVSLAA